MKRVTAELLLRGLALEMEGLIIMAILLESCCKGKIYWLDSVFWVDGTQRMGV